jgi:adenylate kinase family enzyme
MEFHTLFFGVNGSGKTTQGRVLAGLMDRQYVDMSRIIKLANRFDPVFGTSSAPYVAAGDLVPDSVLMPPVERYFNSLRNGEFVVMGGLYRDPGQVPWTTQIISQTLGHTQLAVVDLILTPEDAIARCKKRAEDDHRRGVDPRPDDIDEEKICKRISIHNTNKQPVLDLLVSQLGARVCPVQCCKVPQDTLLNIIRALGLKASDLRFTPAGL